MILFRCPATSRVKSMSKQYNPTVIDLFAGGGGLSSSLEAVGWRAVAAVEIDPHAVLTLQANQSRGHLKGTSVLHADIREVRAGDLRPSTCKSNWRPDLLAGGPPCQPFSSAGLMKSYRDPRGRLFHEFVRLADELRPRFILFENVAGLVTAKSPSGEVGGVLRHIQREFESIGYACRFALLNAADYGAPQRRVRLYMIGARGERLPEFPAPTHARHGAPLLPWVTLGQLLSTQPTPAQTDIVLPSARRARELAELTPGTGLRSIGIIEANRPSGHWGYRQDCFVADLDLPSRTIRAASTPDWLNFDGYIRRLTWRECAALQGFPAEWQFVGTVASRFRQVGNAVQGHIGRALGEQLYTAAKVKQRARSISVDWPANFYKRVRYTAMEEVVNGAHRRAARERSDGAITPAMV